VMFNPHDPHAGQPVLTSGPKPQDARLALILVHGRGASAEDILGLGQELQLDDVACVAPQASGSTWYPYSFLTPMERNEPGITSGLRVVDRLVATLGEHGLPPERVGLLGFSQGACLSLEYAARHARRYGAVIAYTGTAAGTPVFLGCSDIDPHIPLERVHESADVFRRLGASVDERIYPGMGHTVNRDEIEAVRGILRGIETSEGRGAHGD
jgi:predicted esterase